MAIDLKTMLAKVLGSGGEKKFFFAYGAGKRKDKKGDGELAVAGQKPKKPEVEGALDGCKEFMEGVCWVGKGSQDSDTIYFQCKGKKLSSMVVAKMALAAKHITTKQYDFQVPSAAEEERVAHINEGVSEDHPTTAPTPTPEKKSEPEVQPTKGSGEEDKHKVWKEHLDHWTPALKAAMTGGGPFAGQVGKLLAEANGLAEHGDPAQAIAKLDEASWLAQRHAVEQSCLKAIKDHPGKAGQLRGVLAYADGKAQSRDFANALKALEGMDKILHELGETPQPPPTTDLVKKRKFLIERWQRIPEEVRADLQKLKTAIAKEIPDEDAEKLVKLAEGYLEDVYTEMKEAIDDDINTGDAHYKAAIGTIGAFRSKLGSEPLIQHFKKENHLKVELSVESILLNALAEVEHALAS